MRVFVTGASGFIGSAVVPELLGAGHRAVGLARSDASAAALRAAGAEVLRGSIEDLEILRTGATGADGVIHLAFNHDDMSRFAESATAEARAIETLGAALEGSERPLVVAAGTAAVMAGRVATAPPAPSGNPRQAGVRAALALAERGVRTSIVGLPPSVHSRGDRHGLVTRLVTVAREKRVSGFIGDGANRWPAVHRLDAARLFRLALEKLPAGAAVHAVGDEGLPIRTIAEVIGRRLDVPVASIPAGDAGGHFGGFLAWVLALDIPASSVITRELLGWEPTHPGLLADLEDGDYLGERA